MYANCHHGVTPPKPTAPELKMNAWSAAHANESAPIFRLPNELLTIIVRFSRDINPPRRIPPASQREVLDTDSVDFTPWFHEPSELHLGWIYLTHVCHTLRAIAFGCSDLWTLIDTNVLPKDWCLEMIDRSANSTLSFSRDWVIPTFGLEELSPAHLAKTRRIHVCNYASHSFNLNDPGFNTFISSLLYDAPYLEEFHFYVSISEEILQGRLSLPDTLFAPEGHRTSQHLRKVSLLNVIPPLNAPFLTDLTTLSITFSDDVPKNTRDHYALPTAQLLSALQRMPFLELLALRNCLPDRWTVQDLDTALPLTHLKKIDAVTRNPVSLSLLLQACYTPTLMTPGSRVLQARFCVAHAPAQCDVVLSALSTIFTSNSFPRWGFVHEHRGFEAVALTFNGGWGSAGRMPEDSDPNAVQPFVRVEAWSGFEDYQKTQEKTIDLTIPAPQPIGRQTSSFYMCRELLDVMHLPLLRSLSLIYDWGLDYRRSWTIMDIEEVRELLGRFPNLERLTCGAEMASHLIALLSEGASTSEMTGMSQTPTTDIDMEYVVDESTSEDHTLSTPFLLELRSIRFLAVDFKRPSPLDSTLTLEDALLRMIDIRRERGAPIQHIMLSPGWIYDDWWMMLRKKLRMMVPRVDLFAEEC